MDTINGRSMVDAFSIHIVLQKIVYVVHVSYTRLCLLGITWVEVVLLKRRVIKYNYNIHCQTKNFTEMMFFAFYGDILVRI